MKDKFDSENIWRANEIGATAYVGDRKTTLIFINEIGRVFKQNKNGYWYIPRRGIAFGGDKSECLRLAKTARRKK